MPRRLPASIVLIAILLIAGSWGWFQREADGSSSCTAAFSSLDPSPAARLGPAPRRRATELSLGEASRSSSLRAASPDLRRPVTLSDDDTLLVAEIADLQLLAQGTHLALDPRQWSALAGVTFEAQTLRQNFEAHIARAVKVAPDRFRLDIPMYAAAGDAMRTRFQTALRTALGEVAASAVLAEIGTRLEGRFAGFGLSAQTLEVVGDPRGPRPDCQVTRIVSYWNSVEGRDRLDTRRETHFPAWEDPSGESWGALLAVVDA